MNILFCTYQYDRNIGGGATVYAIELSRELLKICDLEVSSCDKSYSKELSQMGTHMDGIQNAKYIHIPDILQMDSSGLTTNLYYCIKQRSYDFNKYGVCLFNDHSLAFVKNKIPNVLVIHHPVAALKSSNWKENIGIFYDLFFEKFAIKKADKIICVSEFTKKELLKYCGKIRILLKHWAP